MLKAITPIISKAHAAVVANAPIANPLLAGLAFPVTSAVAVSCRTAHRQRTTMSATIPKDPMIGRKTVIWHTTKRTESEVARPSKLVSRVCSIVRAASPRIAMNAQ